MTNVRTTPPIFVSLTHDCGSPMLVGVGIQTETDTNYETYGFCELCGEAVLIVRGMWEDPKVLEQVLINQAGKEYPGFCLNNPKSGLPN